MEKHNTASKPIKPIETFGSSLIDTIVSTKMCIEGSIEYNIAFIVPKGDNK